LGPEGGVAKKRGHGGAAAGKGGGGNFVRYNTKGGKGNHSFGYESKYVVHI